MATGSLGLGRARELLRVVFAGVALFAAAWPAAAVTVRPSAATAVCPNSAQTMSNVEYFRPDGAPLLLDAAIPDGRGPFPTAIIVHGGYWVEGDKTTDIGPLNHLLSGAGYAWFSIDYRLAPRYRYPAAVEDVEAAVRWVRAHSEQYHVELNRIVLVGKGAGGYLAAMAGIENQPVVAGVVAINAPSDLTIAEGQGFEPPRGLPEFFGVTDFSKSSLKILHDASPVNHVREHMPPFLFIHGTADETVPFVSSQIMCEAMRNAGAQCQIQKLDDAKHGVENWEGKPCNESWKLAMIDSLNRNLKVRPGT